MSSKTPVNPNNNVSPIPNSAPSPGAITSNNNALWSAGPSPPTGPVCSIYLDELCSTHNLAPSDGCVFCGNSVFIHARQPVSRGSGSGRRGLAAANDPLVNRDVIKSLPKWKVDFKVVRPFLQRYEQVLTAGNIPEAEWPKLLLLAVPDVNESKFIQESIITPGVNWSRAVTIFGAHFEKSNYAKNLENDYESCSHNYKATESAQHYADRFENLCTELQIPDGDVRSIKHFIFGLSPQLNREFEKQSNLLALTNNPLILDSRRRVIEVVISLDVILNGGRATPAAPLQSSPAKLNSPNSRNSTNSSKKLHCKYHPSSTSHATSQCVKNPDRNTKSVVFSSPSTSSSNSTSSSLNSRSSSAASSPKKDTVKCHACGQTGHYSSDPKCPKRQSTPREPILTRSKSQSTSSSIQSRTINIDENSSDENSYNNNDSESDIPSDPSASVIDRTLPSSIIVPQHRKILISFKEYIFEALLDTGATASFIDESLIQRFNLSVESTDVGTITLAHASHVTQRIGTISASISVLFPGTDIKCVHLTHIFDVLPLRDNKSGRDYHFIVGTDLIPLLFPDGIPLLFVPPPYSNSSAPSLRELSVTDELINLQQSVHETGAGDLPTDELPVRLSLSTPSELESIHAKKREKMMVGLQSALEFNSKITGFCSLPESRVALLVDPAQIHKLYRKQYPIAQSLWPLADAVINRWFSTGKICLAPPNCEYNNALTIAPKKDENGKMTGIRVCLDTRVLNSMLLINDRFQIPLIRDALEIFSGNLLFGEFDLAEAYLQFQLHPDSRKFTAFTWGKKQYMFVGVPFGINFIPSFFQRIMSQIFSDVPFTFPYIDNLPFGSKTWKEHFEHASIIIDRLNKVNLKIKPSSVNLGHAQIKCLGHILSSRGIGIDPDKVKTILDWPLPKNGAELMSFLGTGTFLRGHIRHYADLTAPLETIKFTKVNIEWNPILIEHFNSTKVAISKAPFLKFPDFSKAFHIATDASNTGIGGVLYQPSSPDEHITPNNIVAICSKKLNPSQQRYPAYKKELWGIVYSLRQFHAYVWGRNDLVIITDHKPLTYMFSSIELSPALQQWLDTLLDYNFKILHRPGILHVLPDRLSRMYSSFYSKSPVWGVSSSPDSSFVSLVGFPPSDLISNSFPQPSLKSSVKGERKATASNNNEIALNNIEIEKFPFKCDECTAHFPTQNGLNAHLYHIHNILSDTPDLSPTNIDPATSNNEAKLLIELEKRGKITPVDCDEKKSLIVKAHLFGHFGQQAVFNRLWHQNYWWPSIRSDIETELQNCDACSRFVVTKSGFHPFTSITAKLPADHLQIDLSTDLPKSPEGYKHLLVIIDVFTGFVILRPVKNKEMETIARKLFKIFCLIGLPKILQSDNGTEFSNGVIRALVKLTGIEQRLISPYNPRADGKVERAIGSVTMIIKKLLHGVHENWPLFVPFAQLSFNNKISSLTGSSPFALMFGRKLNEIKDYSKIDDNNNNPTSISLDNWKEHQEKILSLIFPSISDRISGAKQKLVQTLNKHRRVLLSKAIPTGTSVMIKDPKFIKNPELKGKLEPPYIGPYTVIRRAKFGAYVLKDATGDLLDRHVPVDQMKIQLKINKHNHNDIYLIKKIIKHRGSPGNYEFLVDWKHFKEQTWEPEENILDYEEVKKYWKSINKD